MRACLRRADGDSKAKAGTLGRLETDSKCEEHKEHGHHMGIVWASFGMKLAWRKRGQSIRIIRFSPSVGESPPEFQRGA